MGLNNHHSSVLSHLGANVLGGDSFEFVETSTGLESLLKVLEEPRARSVGAVLQALTSLAERGDVQAAFNEVGPEASTVSLRRLGYLLERLEQTSSDTCHHQSFAQLSDLVWSVLSERGSEPSGEWLGLSSRLRKRDFRRERDEVHVKWGVLSPRDVLAAFAH